MVCQNCRNRDNFFKSKNDHEKSSFIMKNHAFLDWQNAILSVVNRKCYC